MRAERLDVCAEEGRLLQDQLKAVVAGRIVRAGHHDAAIDVQRVGGEIEHRRRAATDVEGIDAGGNEAIGHGRSEEHTSELQSLMRISYAVFCLKKKKTSQMAEQNRKTRK